MLCVLYSLLLFFCVCVCCVRPTAALVVAETIAAKKAERDAEMRRLAEEEARLAKQRMFMGCVCCAAPCTLFAPPPPPMVYF